MQTYKGLYANFVVSSFKRNYFYYNYYYNMYAWEFSFNKLMELLAKYV